MMPDNCPRPSFNSPTNNIQSRTPARLLLRPFGSAEHEPPSSTRYLRNSRLAGNTPALHVERWQQTGPCRSRAEITLDQAGFELMHYFTGAIVCLARVADGALLGDARNRQQQNPRHV